MDQDEKIKEDEIVIADMNVEGMPWYKPGHREKVDVSGLYSLREWLYVYQGAMKAALVVGLCAAAFLILFTLFCVKIWFK